MDLKDPPKTKKRAALIQVLPSKKEEVSENHNVPASRNIAQNKSLQSTLRSSSEIYSDSEAEQTDTNHQRAVPFPVRPAQRVAHHRESRSLFPGESLRDLPPATSLSSHVDEKSSIRRRKKRKRVGVPTEAMAVAHILHDEVRNYLAPQCLPRDERLILMHWYKAVRDQLMEQNEFLVENCRLATERRDLDKQIMKQRQELVALRSNIRGVQSEIKDLESRISVNQQQSRAQRDATRFLEGLGQLAATSQSVQND